ncbi:MAG TPA: TrmH family RNA methyltransferase [Bacteroidetes bacterium]|nr:TrmH family RNA methyltransferase [Bacteroidota bacterium]
MDRKTREALLEYMQEFITEERKQLFDKILNYRTRHITVVLEDLYQPHNASAVLRTCDLTGIQDVHVIENKNKYDVNPDVALGSSKWLNLVKYDEPGDNTLKAFKKLKKQGYRIVATTPHKDIQTPQTIPLESKMALVFGTELTGLSKVAIEHADEHLKIPMYGFTESFNISVSAALILYILTDRLRNSGINWQLTPGEMNDIRLEWVKRTLRKPEIFEKEFLKSYKSK